jgi:hypothetical protein
MNNGKSSSQKIIRVGETDEQVPILQGSPLLISTLTVAGVVFWHDLQNIDPRSQLIPYVQAIECFYKRLLELKAVLPNRILFIIGKSQYE